MPVGSLSAKRLDGLLTTITAGESVGLDALRDVASCVRAIISELDDPARRVVAWVLMKQMESLCDRYDADPMTVDASAGIARGLRGVVHEALLFLNENSRQPDSRSVHLAHRLIEFGREP